MSLFVKICGITDATTAARACEAGADALGFVFADSPRQMTAQRAGAIAVDLPDQIVKVAVFRSPDQRQVDRVLEVFHPDLVQADHDSPITMPEGVGFLPVYRDNGSALPAPDSLILFEGARSGVGKRADWEQAASLVASTRMILAGGLNPANVAEAIQRVSPYGVDVSSGVETAPGEKDPRLIARFVERARQAGAVSRVGTGSP